MSELSEEVNILHPDETLQLMGRTLRIAHIETPAGELRVREFTFGQELELESVSHPLIEAMGQLCDSKPDAIDWNALMAAAAKHPAILKRLLSVSTGMTAEQLDSLNPRDGRLAVMTFFKVNWNFFLDRLLVRSGTRVAQEAQADTP